MAVSEPEPKAEEKPIINIVGLKVALGPFHKGLIPLFTKWDNDFDVCFFSGWPSKTTKYRRLLTSCCGARTP